MKSKRTINENLREAASKRSRTLPSIVAASKTSLSRNFSHLPSTVDYLQESKSNIKQRPKRDVKQAIDYSQGMIDWSRKGNIDLMGTSYSGAAEPAPSYIYILDEYSGATMAYSLRKLSSTYSGSAIEVRRDSDNAVQDIGFVNNELDTASLESFCGGGNGYVSVWYDQSGNGRDASQASASQQPQIVSAGSTLTLSGKPTINSPATLTRLIYPSHNPASANGEITCYAVGLVDNPVESIQIGIAYFGSGSNYGAGLWGGSIPRAFSAQYLSLPSNTPILITGIRGGNLSDDEFWTQGVQRATNTSSLVTGAVSGALFNRTDGAWDWNGSLSEVISYAKNDGANRAAIETNINDYYAIY